MSYEVLKTTVTIAFKKKRYIGCFEKVDKNTTRMWLVGKRSTGKTFLVSQNLFWAASGSSVLYMVKNSQ